jgi:hypothetical protein
MSVGQGSITTQQRRDAPANPGPPFNINSANNGLSVDPVTFRIVLGNDVGGNTATLLNNREIPCDNFQVSLRNANGLIIFWPLAGGSIVQIDLANNRTNTSIPGLYETNDGTLGQTISLNPTLPNTTINLDSNQFSSSGITQLIFNTGTIQQFSIRAGSAATAAAGFIIEKTIALAGIKVFPSGRVFIGVTTPNPVDSGAAAQLQIGGALITAAGAPLTVAPVAIRFGGLVVAAAVLDATQYIEVVHAGVLRKLALIV